MAKDPNETLDLLVAGETLLARAFMIEVLGALAAREDAPKVWLAQFIAKVHGRLDVNEMKHGDQWQGAHELARSAADEIGSVVHASLPSG